MFSNCKSSEVRGKVAVKLILQANSDGRMFAKVLLEANSVSVDGPRRRAQAELIRGRRSGQTVRSSGNIAIFVATTRSAGEDDAIAARSAR